MRLAGPGVHGIQKLDHPGRRVVCGLFCWRHVPIFGARQAFLQVTRCRRGMRRIVARNHQAWNVKAQQILGLGAGRCVAVQQCARHSGHDRFVVIEILPYIAVGKRSVMAQHGGPWPAARIGIEWLSVPRDELGDG